jgi:hypothetical protein
MYKWTDMSGGFEVRDRGAWCLRDVTETSATVALLGIVTRCAGTVRRQVTGFLTVVTQLGGSAIGYSHGGDQQPGIDIRMTESDSPAMWPTGFHRLWRYDHMIRRDVDTLACASRRL